MLNYSDFNYSAMPIEYKTPQDNLSISTNPDDQESEEQCGGIQWQYASVPILFMSLFLGYLIRSYHKTLIPQEKTTMVLLDIGITNYLQAIIIFDY